MYSDWGTFGTFSVSHGSKEMRCYSCERPWQDNAVNVSCIPTGLYVLKRGNFRGKYENYELQDVPGRTFIEIHRGNTMHDVKGCILLGEKLNLSTQPKPVFALLNSTGAFTQFMDVMDGAPVGALHIFNRKAG